MSKAGNYNAFTSAGGGTVEYSGNSSFTLTARTTYNHLEFSGTGIKTLSNVNLTINGRVLVGSGTVRNPSNVTLTLNSLSDDFTNQGSFDLGNGSLQVARAVVNTSQLTLGQGTLSTGTTFTNSGTVAAGAGTVTVGTTLLNPGTYNAGSGSLLIDNDLQNTGTFNANLGAITVGDSLLTAGVFQAGSGAITVMHNLTNTGTYTANANLLTIYGTFANQGGSFNAGSGQIMLEGNWVNAATFTAGSSTVSFLSNSTRTLAGSVPTTFHTVNKVGSGSLVLAQNATVADILSLDSGNIETGSNILSLTNQATQPIVGQSQTAYVAGKLAISFPNTINTSRVFPVGSGLLYRPVTIRQNATGTNNPVVLVEMINSAPTGTLAPSLSNLSKVRYYAIRTLSAGTTIGQPTVRLSFNTNGTPDEGVNVPGNLRIARSTSSTGPWTNAGGSGVFTPAAPAGNAVSGITTIDTGSFFALASTNEIDNPLPVELTRFDATAQAKAVLLTWATANEKNSAYFEVQRSADGRSFAPLGRVAAQSNSSRVQEYSSRDEQPLAGLSYYRLRMVDQDGSHSFSAVVAVRFNGTPAPASVLAYPNPSKGNGFRLAAANLPTGPATLQIVDMYGRVLNRQALDFSQSDVAVKLPQPLAAGVYILMVETSAGKFSQKLVVE